jgi:LemA protein
MKKGTIVLIAIVAIVVLLALFGVSKYNGMVQKSEYVDSKFADIDTQLQRRMDLIPNLVESVKGIMSHEQAIIDSVTSARAELAGAKTVGEKAAANDKLTTALNNLLVVVENYPNISSNTNFIQLQDELAGTENRIATARKDYNDAVQDFNATIKTFPNSIIAGFGGFTAKEYFKAAEGSNEVPKVNFN